MDRLCLCRRLCLRHERLSIGFVVAAIPTERKLSVTLGIAPSYLRVASSRSKIISVSAGRCG